MNNPNVPDMRKIVEELRLTMQMNNELVASMTSQIRFLTAEVEHLRRQHVLYAQKTSGQLLKGS